VKQMADRSTEFALGHRAVIVDSDLLVVNHLKPYLSGAGRINP
jgi:hypothetical protein